MFSGLYPFETGYTKIHKEAFNETLPGIISLPALLRQNGYFTERIGKIFHMGIPGGIGLPGADNTIIVFTGDQGFHLGEHGYWHKSSMFEEACRVPLIVVDPRQKEKGKKCTNLSGLIDIYPTLCELTGIEAPHKLSGLSLVLQLNDVNAPVKLYEFTMGTPNGYGIRSERYRYTEWRKDEINADYFMLYDLEEDPNEFNNLIDDPNSLISIIL